MTYNVFGGTLNLTLSIYLSINSDQRAAPGTIKSAQGSTPKKTEGGYLNRQ